MDGSHLCAQLESLQGEECQENRPVLLENTPIMRVYRKIEVGGALPRERILWLSTLPREGIAGGWGNFHKVRNLADGALFPGLKKKIGTGAIFLSADYLGLEQSSQETSERGAHFRVKNMKGGALFSGENIWGWSTFSTVEYLRVERSSQKRIIGG